MTPREEVEQLRDRLARKVAAQARAGREFYDYYTAEHQPPSVRKQYSQAYELLLGMSNSPLARLVVDAIAERLEVIGVRVRDDETDRLAWEMWKRNRIDAYQTLVHRDALITGHGFASVWYDPQDKNRAVINPESSAQVAVEYEPGSFREVRAAIKMWQDGDDAFATLYTRDMIYKWRAKSSEYTRLEDVTWDERESPAPNPLKAVPIVPFETRPLVTSLGRSELADLIPIIRRVDKLVLDMLLTAETSAFIQRYVVGAEVERDENGQPISPFQAAADRIWMIENPDAKIGQLDPGSLDGYLKAIDSQIAMLAAVSRVPAYYLYTASLAQPPSADSLRAGEAGLIFKVHERMASYGESWEQITRLGLKIERPDIADETHGMDIVWKPAAMDNPSQMADRAVKARAVDVPLEAVWEMLGATPTEVNRWRALREQELMMAALYAPTAEEEDGGVQIDPDASPADQARQVTDATT